MINPVIRFEKSEANKKEKILEALSKFGDAFVFYRKIKAKGTTHFACTADFSTPYVAHKLAISKPMKVGEDEILVFNWAQDQFRVLPVSHIFKVEHLGTAVNTARVSTKL